MKLKKLTNAALISVIALVIFNSLVLAQTSITCLQNAHAHNDYYHDRPLLDALALGFKSIEVDIFLKDGQLLVGHDQSELQPYKTLEKLYLKPLLDYVNANNGYVYEDQELWLVIDCKNNGTRTYSVLKPLLKKYESIITTYSGDKIIQRAVRIIMSGKRPWDIIVQDKSRCVCLGGNIKRLESDVSASVMPLISERWHQYFTWDGNGQMPSDEYSLLVNIVSRTHEKGRKVRFWQTPDRSGSQRLAVWQMLRKAGVDLINTDDLDGLADFLKTQ